MPEMYVKKKSLKECWKYECNWILGIVTQWWKKKKIVPGANWNEFTHEIVLSILSESKVVDAVCVCEVEVCELHCCATCEPGKNAANTFTIYTDRKCCEAIICEIAFMKLAHLHCRFAEIFFCCYWEEKKQKWFDFIFIDIVSVKVVKQNIIGTSEKPEFVIDEEIEITRMEIKMVNSMIIVYVMFVLFVCSMAAPAPIEQKVVLDPDLTAIDILNHDVESKKLEELVKSPTRQDRQFGYEYPSNSIEYGYYGLPVSYYNSYPYYPSYQHPQTYYPYHPPAPPALPAPVYAPIYTKYPIRREYRPNNRIEATSQKYTVWDLARK